MQYPVTITLTINSDNELLNLWHRLNVADNTISALAHDYDYRYTWDGTANSWLWWIQVDKLVKQARAENQL